MAKSFKVGQISMTNSQLCITLLYAYQRQPIVIDLLASSVTRELDAEFATIRVGRIFPFWSNTLLEKVIVGVGIEVVDFGNIVVNTKSRGNSWLQNV